MIPQLRPYQHDLMNRARAALTTHRILVVQATTGAGKTVWSSALAKNANNIGRKVLFLVHRRRLVDQIRDTLMNFEIMPDVLMRGESQPAGAPTCVASRDTLLSRCVNNQWLGMPQADIVIVDEAHHAADPQSEYRRILNFYSQAKIILLSATPVDSEGNGLGPWAEAIECAAPTTQLIRDGFLVGLDIYCPDRKIGRGGKAKRGVAGGLLDSWKEFARNQPTVLFVSRVQYSKDAVAAFNEADIPAAHIDANTDDYERDRVFDQLAEGRIKVVSNVGIIGEGVDVPELGCCQLFCEISGRVKLLQAAGRVMRPSPGKEKGVLIDHSAAVFRYGFPDEDSTWPLNGNADADFNAKHDKGETDKAFYCKHCERVYHGAEECPQCGRKPVKPPRSIFAPPPPRTTGELLLEADRNGFAGVDNREEKIKHWLRCLAVAANRNGPVTMASVIYKRKYNAWPEDGFPCNPPWKDRGRKVTDLYPNFRRGRKSA